MPSIAMLEIFVTVALFLACLFNIYIDRKYKDEEMARIKDAIEAIQLKALREDRSSAYAAWIVYHLTLSLNYFSLNI